MNVSAAKARRWIALGAMVTTMLAATLAFGEGYSPCYEAYWMSGPAQQQMSFREFSRLYSDDLCFSGSEHQEVQAHR